jgi:monofunctional biosynthetic peptidoglycan transglycosylase
MKSGFLKLILRIVKLVFVLFVGLSLLWVLFYRFVNPPVTWLMISVLSVNQEEKNGR